MSVIGTVFRTVNERMARNKSLPELTARLEESGQEIAQRMEQAPDTPRNRDLAAHFIGIERWGQRRLRCALGEAPLIDEYDGYRPDDLGSMSALRDAFLATRAETLALANRLQQAGVDATATAPHNGMGEVTVRGWLNYLDAHARRESGRIK